METTEIEQLENHEAWVFEVNTISEDCQDQHFSAKGYTEAKEKALRFLSELNLREVASVQLRPYGLNWDSGETLFTTYQ